MVQIIKNTDKVFERQTTRVMVHLMKKWTAFIWIRIIKPLVYNKHYNSVANGEQIISDWWDILESLKNEVFLFYWISKSR